MICSLPRGLERETVQRGYGVEEVMRSFPELKWDYEKFIVPVRGVVDLVLVMKIGKVVEEMNRGRWLGFF